MAFSTGSGATLQIGKEATFGTAVTPTALVNLTDESIVTSVEKTDEGSLLASKTPMTRDLMAVNVDGSISFKLRPEFAGLLFHLALGGTDTVSGGGPLYTHTMNLVAANTNLPSATIVVDRKVAIKKYAGCTISNLSLDFNANDYVQGSIDIIGTNESTGTLAALSAFTVPSYRCTAATLTVGGNSIDVEGVSVSINNNLEESPATYSTGLYKGQPQHGMRNVTVSINLPYSAAVETFKTTYLLTETNAAVVLTCASSDTDYTLTITLPNVSINSANGNVSGEGIIESTIEGEALSVGGTEPITVAIQDKTSTGYGA
jgi:hypothetical protein